MVGIACRGDHSQNKILLSWFNTLKCFQEMFNDDLLCLSESFSGSFGPTRSCTESAVWAGCLGRSKNTNLVSRVKSEHNYHTSLIWLSPMQRRRLAECSQQSHHPSHRPPGSSWRPSWPGSWWRSSWRTRGSSPCSSSSWMTWPWSPPPSSSLLWSEPWCWVLMRKRKSPPPSSQSCNLFWENCFGRTWTGFSDLKLPPSF